MPRKALYSNRPLPTCELCGKPAAGPMSRFCRPCQAEYRRTNRMRRQPPDKPRCVSCGGPVSARTITGLCCRCWPRIGKPNSNERRPEFNVRGVSPSGIPPFYPEAQGW